MRSLITLVFLVHLAFVGADQLDGQTLGNSHLIQKSEATNTSPSRSLVQEVSRPATAQTEQAVPAQAVAAKQQPWKIDSRIHLEKGTNTGYLVVEIQLSEGHHLYSLNPEGSVAPTRLAVLPSNDLRVKSKFVADTAPIVIEKDPVFERRIEKHKGQVRFFAPIEVRGGIDHTQLSQEVQFSAQVCSDNGCRPIRDLKLTASFGGYFEVPKTGNRESAGQTSVR